jgi:2-dehydropantoate 2-reductase
MTVAVFGAGSIGCYVGGRLAGGGADVVLVGREAVAREVGQYGLRVTDWQGADVRVDEVAFATTPEAVAGAELVLVTVKSGATETAAEQLAEVVGDDTTIVSFQNGLRNAETLRTGLPGRTVLTGMVQFNVVRRGEGVFHAGTEGGLEVEDHPALAPYLDLFERAGLALERHRDMVPVQWAKLLLNLNNPVNALSGLPLKAELEQRAFRRCAALAQAEAIRLLDAAGIKPAKLTPLPPRWIPRLLTAPDVLFTRLAAQMLAIDPLARTSMLDDLEAGRPTEVDYLNGEVVRLAERAHQTAPVNARLVELIREAENHGRRNWSGSDLYDALRSAR